VRAIPATATLVDESWETPTRVYDRHHCGPRFLINSDEQAKKTPLEVKASRKEVVADSHSTQMKAKPFHNRYFSIFIGKGTGATT
jgi:hypothetical protein